MKLARSLPSECVHLPGVPDGMRRQRDQAIAAMVIHKGWTIEQAANVLNQVLGQVDGAIDDALRRATDLP